MSQKDSMLAGKLYLASDKELKRLRNRAKRIIGRFNRTHPTAFFPRKRLVKKLFGKTGEDFSIEPPFYCDYGKNITIGSDFYANYGCILLDVNRITIGDNVLFGPRVCLYTAGHPIDATIRKELYEFGHPITIGDDVWIGGNTVINPGVTIGSRTVIGSGSVVTKDIPSDVVAAGNPCRVIRPITEADSAEWKREKQRIG
ncbi:MAG: sugar O-acetyltransferase [Acholeplasmataceae bacterium]